MHILHIVTPALSLALANAMAGPAVAEAADRLEARGKAVEAPCYHRGGKDACESLCTGLSANFWSCAPDCVCRDHNMRVIFPVPWPPTAPLTPPPSQLVTQTSTTVSAPASSDGSAPASASTPGH